MQRDTSLNLCDGLSHRGHTCTRVWQHEGSASIEYHECYLCQAPLTLQAGSSGPRPLGMSFGSKCRLHRVVRYGLFTDNSRRLSIFTPPGATYRCPFTEPLDGFRSTSGQSSGFTSDSPAPESTVISRYRPRLPSVSTGSLSIDLLLVVTVDRSTSSGHYSHSEQIQSKLRQVDHLLHRRSPTPFFRTSGAERTFFWCPVWRSQRSEGSRRLCGRRRKPRLEPNVRSSRFVIVREIPNATPFRVATYTPTTLPFQKMPNAMPIGLFPTSTLVRKKEVRMSFNRQMSVHTQLLTHWCVSCPRIHLLQNIRLFLLPIQTIEEWRLFVSAIPMARFPQLPAIHLCMLWSRRLLKTKRRVAAGA